MRTVLAVMPMPGGQEEKIPRLQYAIEKQTGLLEERPATVEGPKTCQSFVPAI